MNASHRILITDDDLFLMGAYRKLLARDASLKIDCATTPKEAHALMSAHHYDAALLDLELADPEEDGFDLLSSLRRESPETPVLMMSTHDDDATVGRALALGACGFASKNIDFLPSFARRVHGLLESNRQAG